MALANHEGVSCDACIKSNFRGRRYKCLVCYDYDLCGSCRDTGIISGRHAVDHPMQCILTKADMETYFGGENMGWEQGISFTCPYCGETGFGETDLADHVGLKHPNSMNDVLCPICSTMQGGDPNLVTEDLMAHLASDHQSPSEASSGRAVASSGRRRYGRTATNPVRIRERRVGASSTSQSNGAARTTPRELPFQGTAQILSDAGILSDSTTMQQLLQPSLASSRENAETIAELWSHLTQVRRTGAVATSSIPPPAAPHPAFGSAFASQAAAASLQQLQMQLQMERQSLFSRVENLRNAGLGRTTASDPRLAGGYAGFLDQRQGQAAPQLPAGQAPVTGKGKKEKESQLLLDKLLSERNPDSVPADYLRQRADQALFIQELILGTLCDSFDLKAAVENTAEEDRRQETETEPGEMRLVPPAIERMSSSLSIASSTNMSTAVNIGSERAESEVSEMVEDVGAFIPDRSPALSAVSSSSSLPSMLSESASVSRAV